MLSKLINSIALPILNVAANVIKTEIDEGRDSILLNIEKKSIPRPEELGEKSDELLHQLNSVGFYKFLPKRSNAHILAQITQLISKAVAKEDWEGFGRQEQNVDCNQASTRTISKIKKIIISGTIHVSVCKKSNSCK
jgi:hypothetical protein